MVRPACAWLDTWAVYFVIVKEQKRDKKTMQSQLTLKNQFLQGWVVAIDGGGDGTASSV